MTKKLTKQDMRQDAFRDFLSLAYKDVEQSLEHHWKIYLAGLVVFLAALVGGMQAFHYVEARKDSASMRLAKVMEAFNAPVLSADDPSRKELSARQSLFFDSSQARDAEVTKRIEEALKGGGPVVTRNLTLLYKAEEASRAQRYDEAISISDPLCADPPADVLAVMLQARVFEAQKKADKAEAAWKKLSTMKSAVLPDGAAEELLGEYYERAGEAAKAEETYKAAQAVLLAKGGEKDPLLARVKERLEQMKAS